MEFGLQKLFVDRRKRKMAEQQEIILGGDSEMKAEEMEPKASYVVHGAYAFCGMGSRPARLVVPACHGTYLHDMPILTIYDTTPGKNVQVFGYCNSSKNPERIAKAAEIQANVEQSGGLMNLVMDIFSGIGSLFGKKKETEVIEQQVMVVCNPIFAPTWQNGSKELLINGAPALNTNATLECLKCGEIVSILEDGQENAVNEQKGKIDFQQWSEGDPIPDPTQSNLEALNQNIEKLEQEVNRYHEPEEQEALERELEAKKAMRGQMAETVGILNDIKVQEFYAGAYGEEAETRWNTLQETKGAVLDAYRGGNSIQAVNNEKITDLVEKSESGKKMEALSTEKKYYQNGELVSEREVTEWLFPEDTNGWEKGEALCREDTKLC